MREAQAEIRSTMSVNTLESGSKLDDKNDPEKNPAKRSSNSNYSNITNFSYFFVSVPNSVIDDVQELRNETMDRIKWIFGLNYRQERRTQLGSGRQRFTIGRRVDSVRPSKRYFSFESMTTSNCVHV